jgi:hypothetical protein
MTWLLVVYLFLPDGTAISSRFEQAAATYEQCKSLGWEKAKVLRDEYYGKGTYSFICIDTSKVGKP